MGPDLHKTRPMDRIEKIASAAIKLALAGLVVVGCIALATLTLKAVF